jgi:hypothetical protein
MSVNRTLARILPSVSIRVQPSHIAELAIDVRMQFAQLIASRLAVNNACQVFGTVAQHPRQIHFLEFIG